MRVQCVARKIKRAFYKISWLGLSRVVSTSYLMILFIYLFKRKIMSFGNYIYLAKKIIVFISGQNINYFLRKIIMFIWYSSQREIFI